ncbi:His/Gly/Thr/Pro-type tRNA ligase C-terminal domain-containing protein, partial [Aureimonas sp. AU12]|uniref:His/Gly/Thr/Pro-type tRNA ligase C-terminal domain-containing protein n=1 Tax=Aureimonas sp. AU12 TaxID=1638161 RepID=UPI000A887233
AVPAEGVDFADAASLAGIVEQWTTPYAATEEMHDTAAWDAVPEGERVAARGIEVGHIFHFGTKYSEPMKAFVTGPDGKETPVFMGSYGIGPSRLIAAIIEASHDEAGIIWPKGVAPFDIGLVNMKPGDADCDALCERLYAEMQAAGHDVLYDDQDTRAGAKFASMDLIGLPVQVIVGPRGAKAGEVEIKNRAGGERETIAADDVMRRLAA